MSDKSLEILQNNEVINISNNNKIRESLCLPPTCLVKDFKNAIANKIASGNGEETEKLLEGIKCEVIQFKKGGWESGKIKIAIEFCPDDE